jgi:hypothetical protein
LEHKPHQESIQVLIRSILSVKANKIIVKSTLSNDVEEQACCDHPSREDVEASSVLGIVMVLEPIQSIANGRLVEISLAEVGGEKVGIDVVDLGDHVKSNDCNQ